MGNDLRYSGERGYLGVSTQPLSGELGDYFGVKDNKGALVADVVKDSPADKLGLKAGDVIVKVADKDIEDPVELSDVIGNYEDPETVDVVWIRDHKEQSGKVQLEVRQGRSMRWFNGPMLGYLDDFGHGPDVRRRVQIERYDGDLDRELDSLRNEVRDLRNQIDEMRKNK